MFRGGLFVVFIDLALPLLCGGIARFENKHFAVNSSSTVGAAVTDAATATSRGADMSLHRKVIWVRGFPRTGTSTILSMLKASIEGVVADDGGYFSLFEPCHPGDEITTESGGFVPWGEPANTAFTSPPSGDERIESEETRQLLWDEHGCEMLLQRIMACDFTNIRRLWGWSNWHTTSHGNEFSPSVADTLCQSANTVFVKTVGAGKVVDLSRRIDHAQGLLDANPNLQIIEVVRDPRAIYASWRSTDPFPRILQERNYPVWKEACETFDANMHTSSSRVHRIVFEEFIRQPWKTMKQTYSDVGLMFGIPQEEWFHSMFDTEAAGCTVSHDSNRSYADCHSEPAESLDRWRGNFTAEELREFAEYEPCQRVFSAYGYPLY